MDIKRIWCIGDLHFGVHVNSIKWLDIQSDYFYNYLIPLLKKEYKPGDVLLQAGDIFENRHFLNVNILNKAIQILNDIANIIPTIIIAGNHDVYYVDNNEVNSISFLSDLNPNIQTYIKPHVIDNILLLPWDNNPDSITNTLNDNINCDIVFAHMDISGMKYDNSRVITNGVSKDILRQFKKIYSGHIHLNQVDGNIIYTGTPYQLDRGDLFSNKGIYLIDPINHTEEFIINTYSPVFNKIHALDLLEMSVEEINQNITNTFLDIAWPSELSNFNIKALTDFFEKYKIKPLELNFPPVGELDKMINIEISERFKLTELAEAWLKEAGYKQGDIINCLTYFEELQERHSENEK